ncbi:ABC transporter substrate-binding protein/permease [Paenibacillus shenyangensis]|uniref:ABC transporter substrate-binding protein/permease n=1 Tax=Paenibacillus sp. A9 TaxID=1284352 RepID=UPI00037C2E53|nr:ABC transporter substrate-binding protein/permease [Paenibacillus sp. A9]
MKALKPWFACCLSMLMLFFTVIPLASAAQDNQKVITVGLSADFPPYEFHKKIDGTDQIVGSDVEIAKQIAADMGATLQIQDIPFDSLLPALNSGRIDMIISGMTPTEERRQNVDFSESYYISRQVIMTRVEDKDKYTSVDSLQGASIGVQKGSIQEEIAKGIKDAKLTSVDRIADIVLSLESGRVDAAVMEGPVAEGQVANHDDLAITSATIPDSDTEMAIAVKKGNTELLGHINGTLAKLNQGDQVKKFVQDATALNSGEQKSNNIFTIFWDYRQYYMKGIQYTLLLSAAGVLFGFLIGLVVSLFRLSNVGVLRWIAVTYTEILRGTPMLVQLLIIHYGIAQTFHIEFSVLESGIITLSINSSAYLAEIFRAGIQGVDRGQMEAARSLGMSHGMTMRSIIIPQAVKSVLPAIGNEFVVIIKESSIVSFIGVADLMFQAQAVRSITYSALNPLLIAAAIYFIMTFVLSKLLGMLERRWSVSDKR